MKKQTIVLSAVAAAIVGASSIAWAAKSWNLPNEEISRFDGKVTDALCAITGDCPQDCGAGRRQLGVMTSDDKFVLVLKNHGIFQGGTDDLIDFCNKEVTLDGLFSTNYGNRTFAVHFIKEKVEGSKWRKANRWGPKWAKRNGLKAKDKKQNRWFSHDPRVKEIIKRDGFLGLGEAEDKKFLADY